MANSQRNEQSVPDGVFRRLWRTAWLECDLFDGIQWDLWSTEGAITKAPLGGQETRRIGPRPELTAR